MNEKYKNKTVNVLHFFPLIGGGYLGVEALNKIKGYDIVNMPKGFSLSGAKANEAALLRNRPLDIEYYDETYADLKCDCMTCNSDSHDYDIECSRIDKLIEDNQAYISTADIIESIPPCNSLCGLNCSAASRTGKGNRASQIMIRCCEFAVKSGVDNFVFENAPALIGKGGKPLLEQMEILIDKYGYSMSLLKTNSRYHGQGQKRERSFVYLFKGKTPKILDVDTKIEDMSKVIGNFNTQDVVTEPTTWQQKFLSDAPGYTLKYYKNQRDDYKTFTKFYDFFKLPMATPYGKFHLEMEEADMLKKFDLLMEDLYGHIPCENKRQEKVAEYSRRTAIRGSEKVRTGKGGYWGNEPISCYDKFTDKYLTHGIIGKNFGRYLHPDHDRFLTFTEEKRLMGIPDGFEVNEDEEYYISQNVPALTFMVVTEQILKNLEDAPTKISFTKINGRAEAKQKLFNVDTVSELPF
jgi:site-specific DNA-cytosine methylase